MKKKCICLIKIMLMSLGFFCYIKNSYAYQEQSSVIIKNIKINGLQRIEIGTVFSYLPVKVGDILDNNQADEIINRLYKTGFFKDIRISEDEDTLIIDVVERPVIAEVIVIGDHEFDHDILMRSLRENGLADGKIFDQSIIEQAILGLKIEYANRGLYSVSITPKVIALERNRVSINIDIQEGVAAKIADIKFVGNKDFTQKQLEKQMFLNTGTLFSWWFKDNQYSSDKLSGDIEKIRSFYLNQGYIEQGYSNFMLKSVQVQLTPDKKSVYITINLEEGKQYHIDKVKILGDTKDVPIAKLEELVTLKSGDIVNQAQINKSIENIKNILGNSAFAFAAVTAIPEVDNKNLLVNYSFFIDTGKKVYVRQININGNDKTRDVVIRRELRQTENSLYNTDAIQRSKDRLNLLGYFKDTDLSTIPIPGTNDQVDMKIKVKEADTGGLNFGIGYTQGSGLMLNAAITQASIFGSGKSVSLSGSNNTLNQTYALSFTDPYFLANGTSLGYDLYSNNYTPNKASISPFSTEVLGAKARTAVPVSEFDKINFSLAFENNNITTYGNNVPTRFFQFLNQFGNTVNEIPLSISWVRNTTDSSLWPTKGAMFNETLDGTLPGVGAQYIRFTSENKWFIPITSDFTWKINGTIGIINAYGNSSVPFYQNYFIGGPASLRGYYPGSIGPKDTDSSALGGTEEILVTNDVLLPIPGFKDNRTLRLDLYYDMGALWGGNNFNLSFQQSFRASYGVGLIWISPVGPMKVMYSWPLFNQPNDNIQNFQFIIGTSF